MVRRTTQRMASLAIRKKIASNMTPAMIEMVVNVIRDISRQLSVVCLSQSAAGRQHSVYCLLLLLLFLIARAHHRLDVSAHMKVSFNFHPQRIARAHKVFENHIDDVLVKDLYVAK